MHVDRRVLIDRCRRLVVDSALRSTTGSARASIANWLTRTDDQFAERSTGRKLASTNAVLNTAGLATATYGVVNGLA